MTASAGGTNATLGAEAENENAIHRGVNTSHSNAIRPIVRSVTVGAKNGEQSAGHDVTSGFEQSFPCLKTRPGNRVFSATCLWGLASAPSKQCGFCLLARFGLAQFTAGLFWRFGGVCGACVESKCAMGRGGLWEPQPRF